MDYENNIPMYLEYMQTGSCQRFIITYYIVLLGILCFKKWSNVKLVKT